MAANRLSRGYTCLPSRLKRSEPQLEQHEPFRRVGGEHRSHILLQCDGESAVITSSNHGIARRFIQARYIGVCLLQLYRVGRLAEVDLVVP